MAIDPGATPSMGRPCPAGEAADPSLDGNVRCHPLEHAHGGRVGRGPRGSRGLFRSTLFFHTYSLFFLNGT